MTTLPPIHPLSDLWFAALNSLPDPAAITDTSGLLCFVNPAFERTNGYTAAEVTGHNPRFLKSGLTDPAVYTALWHAIGEGRTFTGRVINQRKNGDHYQAELTVVPLRGHAGTVTHYLSTHRDLSALLASQAALRRSEASFRAMIEGLPDAIIVHRASSVVFVNPVALALLGYRSPEQLLGKPIATLLHPADREAAAARDATLLAEGSRTRPIEQHLLHRDGTRLTVEVICQRLIFDEQPAIVLQAYDLSARKRLTARMEQLDRMTPPTLAAPAPQDVSRANVLIVDDDPRVGAALARGLKREHEVAVVESGQAALDRLGRGERFDLIFSDLLMAGMSGIELYVEIARLYPSEASKVVFLTGAYTPAAVEFLNRTPNLRLDKPFDLLELRALVRNRMTARGL